MQTQRSSSQYHFADRVSLQSAQTPPTLYTTSKTPISNLPTDCADTPPPSHLPHNPSVATPHGSILTNDSKNDRNSDHDNKVSPIVSSSFVFSLDDDDDEIHTDRRDEHIIDDSCSSNQENDKSRNTHHDHQDVRRLSSPGMIRSRR